MTVETLVSNIYNLLDEHKGTDIIILDVKTLTTITDYMIICTATSARHVNALAQYVTQSAKAQGYKILGIEGAESGEWVLIDLSYVVVHLMQSTTRDFYRLEKLWSLADETTDAQSTDAESA